MSKDKFKNVFLLTEGAEPPALNEISKIGLRRSIGSGFKFNPAQEYGAWATTEDAMLVWELFEYMIQVVPKEHRHRIKIVIRRGQPPGKSPIFSAPSIGWLYTPEAKP